MEEKSRANKLNRLATAAWLVISDSYAERLKSFFKDVEKNRDLLNTVKFLPADYSAITTAYQYFIKSALLGISHTVEKKEFDDTPGIEDIESMPFTEAVEYLKARTSISAEEYYQLSDRLKYKAFTVSRIADGDSVEKIKGRITKALKEGGGMKEFLQMQKDEILNKVGLGSSNGYYWETVFRAGSQSSYNTGRMLGFESDPPIALQFIGIEDSRQTDICHSLSNIIRPYGDPFWDSRIPPLHFGCRSTIRGIYDESEIPAKYPEVPEMKAADGWGFNPLKDNHWFEMFPEMEARAENYGLLRDIEFARKKLIESDWKTGRSVGAMSKRFHVDTATELSTLDEESPWYIKEGSDVTAVKIIAEGANGGKDSNRGIDDIRRLITQYPLPNGNLTSEKDWYKVRGTAVVFNGETKETWLADVHYYYGKNIGKVEFKVSKWLRKM